MDDAEARPPLLDHEWIALAALARLLVRTDGTLSVEEVAAVGEVFESFALEMTWASSPYRNAPVRAEMTLETIGAWLDRAAKGLRDGEAVRFAALGVERPVAREAIYGALFELAAADVVASQEWPLLDWLRDAWDLGADGLSTGTSDTEDVPVRLSDRGARAARDEAVSELVVVTLARDTGIRASFRAERWTDAAVRLLRQEIQTGDRAFDERVYVSTETPDATLTRLASARVRAAIAELVVANGPVDVDGDRVVVRLGIDKAAEEEPRLVRLVAALSRR